jgi:hypothetical protein
MNAYYSNYFERNSILWISLYETAGNAFCVLGSEIHMPLFCDTGDFGRGF